MRWWGKWISLVSLDLSDTDEQLNFSEVSLQVTGSSNFVREEMVQFVVIQLSSFGQDSVIVMFPGIWMVNVWNSGSEVGLAEALMEW